MHLRSTSEDKRLPALVLTGVLVSGAIWLAYGVGQRLFCAPVEDRKASFGVLIPGYHAVTFGGDLDNSIDGTFGGEDLLGGKGDDKLWGREGDDFLNGEAGNDLLEGGAGRDIVMGGGGDDTIVGVDSFELVDGGDGDDTLIVPYRCRKFTFSESFPGRGTIRSGCGSDLITVLSVEHLTVEPAPMQGPMPKRKPRLPLNTF